MRKTLKVVAFGGGPADAFIKAAGITDSTQQTAIKTLVNDLNGYGLWSKMKAIYPMVGGNATAHSYNLKDITKFQIAFSGGWTHSSNGALPNGTNGYGDTGFITNLNWDATNSHASIYNNTNNTPVQADGRDMGIDTTGRFYIASRRQDNNAIFSLYGSTLVTSNNDARGHWLAGSLVNTVKSYKNGITYLSGIRNNADVSSRSIYLANTNLSTGPYNNGYSNQRIAFATIGEGLSDTEAANLYTSIQKFQTTLLRQV